MSAVPKIVCETTNALELKDETPTWKIMDNNGRVTEVFHCNQRQHKVGDGRVSGEGGLSTVTSSGTATPKKQSSLGTQTSIDSCTGKETLFNDPPRHTALPQIIVINHNEPDRVPSGGGGGRLSKEGSSFEVGTAAVHVLNQECVDLGYRPPVVRAGSPSCNATECDFHCWALHKSVATPPIQDSPLASPQQHPSSISDGSRRVSKGHVRFLDQEGCHSQHPRPEHDSSESGVENTLVEQEAVTTEKFLLLIDQVLVDQKRPLNIKDIGIILERLSFEILDVERLDRESEGKDCYNWTIKATIRGDVLRELGVMYKGHYYAISEHPGYKEESQEFHDEEEPEEEYNVLSYETDV